MGKLIGELLVEAKALSRDKLEEALKIPRPAGKKLGQLLIEHGLVTEAQLTQSLSLQLSVPWVSLYHIDFSRALLNRVPREIAEKHCLVPIFVRNVKGQGDTMYVAIEDPTNETALAEVKKAAGIAVRPMIASPSDIRSALRVYYGADEAAGPPTNAHPELKKHDPPPLPPKRPARPAVDPEPKPEDAVTRSEPVVTPESGPPRVGPKRSSDSPDASPDIEVSEFTLPGKKAPRMVALTLLDGTSIQVPARPRGNRESAPPSAGGMSDQLTARDLISALRALAHGADASEVLGDKAQWEAMFAALLSLLLRKGIIADWEFVDELRKI